MPPSRARLPPTTSPTGCRRSTSRCRALPTACRWAASSTTSTTARWPRPSAAAPRSEDAKTAPRGWRGAVGRGALRASGEDDVARLEVQARLDRAEVEEVVAVNGIRQLAARLVVDHDVVLAGVVDQFDELVGAQR